MLKLFPLVVASVLLIALGGASARADVTMRIKTTEDVGSATPEVSTGVMYLAPDRMAQHSDSNDDDSDTDVIFRADRGLMWFVDRESKTYRQVDRTSIEAFAAKIEQARAQMKKQMESLPPEQRAMIEKNMPAMMPGAAAAPAPKIAYRKTSETKTISGFECTKYERVEDGKVEEALWVAPHSATGFTAEDEAVLRKMGEFMEKLLAAMGPAVSEQVGDEFAAVAELGGWPILTQTLDDDGKVEDETLVESIGREKLADAVFEAPQGYTQKSEALGAD